MNTDNYYKLDFDSLRAFGEYPDLALGSSFDKIDSAKEFNDFCQQAISCWGNSKYDWEGTAEKFALLKLELNSGQDNTIETSWGGVVIRECLIPKVSKYLVVNQGGYLALEKHSVKEERLRVEEGCGLLLSNRKDPKVLSVEYLLAGREVEFSPGTVHCIIALENLLVFEDSMDYKGMDKDLIFIYEPQ